MGWRDGLMAIPLSSESSGQLLKVAVAIVLCSWARLRTLTVPLSIQVYKWVPVAVGKPAAGYHPMQRGLKFRNTCMRCMVWGCAQCL